MDGAELYQHRQVSQPDIALRDGAYPNQISKAGSFLGTEAFFSFT